MIRGIATVLAAVALLAGCTAAGSTSDAGPPVPSTAELRSRAALEPCPEVADAGTGAVPGGQLPDLQLDCLGDGPPVRLAGLRGVPTVVNPWAAWCEPCRKEVPALQLRRLVARHLGVRV